jgi:hypothetical protein
MRSPGECFSASKTRREFVRQLAAGIVAVGVVPVTAVALSRGAHGEGTQSMSYRLRRAPVVSFFMDQPYLDPTGQDMPYLPPRGVRSGQPLAELSEQAFRSALCWV